MIYKRYELSQSLNGDHIIFIARNAIGNVVFRESSEERVKSAIDRAQEERQKQESLAAKKKAERERAKTHRGGLFQSQPQTPEPENTEVSETVVEPLPEEAPADEQVLIPSQQRVTRGPDGKFLSKGALEAEEEQKKSFWDKLK